MALTRMASLAGPDCAAHSAPPCTAIAAEETLGPVAGAGTIIVSQISQIRKILEIATELKTAHLGKCPTHGTFPFRVCLKTLVPEIVVFRNVIKLYKPNLGTEMETNV